MFGAPENPKGTEESVGVPVDERLTNDAGSAFTRTATPTPFSDRTTDIDGSFEYAVTDATPIDTRSSADTATAEFEFTGPSGETAYAVTLQETLPVGPEHPIMGGTAVELVMHGVTGIGTRMQPTQLAYGTLWGRVTVERDGETLAENRLLHVMTTERVRNPSTGRLLFDADLPHEGAQTHVILPPVEVTPDGPRSAPVPTGNGQPFVHLNFFGSSVEGVETLGWPTRRSVRLSPRPGPRP